MSSKPNAQDLAEWYELCEHLDAHKYKCSNVAGLKNNHLIYSKYPAVRDMYAWMRYNDVSPIFYSEGWGWRLRKDWRERLESIKEM